MSDVEKMDSDKEECLPASQMVENEAETEAEVSQAVSQDTEQAATAQVAKSTRGRKPKDPAKAAKKDNLCPCVYNGEHCAKGMVQCTICSLWCHMACTGLSKEVLRGLELQAKEVGRAYWACMNNTK